MSFNRILIYGFLGRDPEARFLPDGTAVTSFSIASTEGKGDKAKTVWFKITAWRQQAEIVNQYLKKGSPVIVQGKFHLEEYTDRDGQKRYSPEVNATEIHFVSAGKGESAEGEPAKPSPKAAAFDAQRPERKPTQPPYADGPDSDIPF